MSGKRLWLVFGLIFVLSIAASAYMMFLGPTRLELGGKTIQDMLDNGALLGAAAVAVSLVVLLVALFSLYRTMNPPEIKNGIQVRGEIAEVSDTGTTLNDNPQIKLLIDFKKNDGSLCQGTVKTIVSRLNAALVRPGCNVDIKYDPNKPERIQLVQVYLAESAAPEANVVQRLTDLQDLRTKGLITEEDYQRRKEEILKEV